MIYIVIFLLFFVLSIKLLKFKNIIFLIGISMFLTFILYEFNDFIIYPYNIIKLEATTHKNDLAKGNEVVLKTVKNKGKTIKYSVVEGNWLYLNDSYSC